MMRSLYSGVSGLRNHQTRMDVIGNNISNVNTVGYKTSRVVFQDIYSQTSKVASAPSESLGGTNPIQIGLGVTLSAIDVLHTKSATQRTDNPLDFAIEGEGFFIVETGGIDKDADDVGSGKWMYTRAGNFYVDNEGYLVNSNGYYIMGVMGADRPTDTELPNTEIPDDPADEKEYPELSAINLAGYKNISIDDSGTIKGLDPDTNQLTTVGYLVLAQFTNTAGLEKKGNSLYAESSNTGEIMWAAPSDREIGKLNPGGLEMSNVDLASEFTDMIVTQRGFQANSRVITTSDTMLEELINLKR